MPGVTRLPLDPVEVVDSWVISKEAHLVFVSDFLFPPVIPRHEGGASVLYGVDQVGQVFICRHNLFAGGVILELVSVDSGYDAPVGLVGQSAQGSLVGLQINDQRCTVRPSLPAIKIPDEFLYRNWLFSHVALPAVG